MSQNDHTPRYGRQSVARGRWGGGAVGNGGGERGGRGVWKGSCVGGHVAYHVMRLDKGNICKPTPGLYLIPIKSNKQKHRLTS